MAISAALVAVMVGTSAAVGGYQIASAEDQKKKTEQELSRQRAEQMKLIQETKKKEKGALLLDQETKKQEMLRNAQKAKASSAGGRSGTILAGGKLGQIGAQSSPQYGSKTLLGQ